MTNPSAGLVPVIHRVERVKREVRDVVTLEMVPCHGTGLPRFAPGQFSMLYAFGTGEVPISISGDPARPHRLVHTVRAVGSVTNALCRLEPGDIAGVRGPFGSCWPVEKASGRDVVLVTGGLGIAAVRAAIYHLLARRQSYGNIALLHGARTPRDVLFGRELARWQRQQYLQVELTVDTAGSDWTGHVGLVTRLIPGLRLDARRAVAMVCGPEIMMRFTVLELMRQGIEPQNIYLSMERNMKCGAGLCGHCQFGPFFVCKDGPVFSFETIKGWLEKREV